jgi:catechol 2,3-dioxygenase-like lactoylglutathione lyase family enzyme
MGGRFREVYPVLPVKNVARALEHYRRLGFQVKAYGEGDPSDPIYGFVDRDDVHLHLTRFAELDPKQNCSACYLKVADAAEIHAEWSRAGVPGHLSPPADQPYGLREFFHVDPDGNLLRVGSDLSPT